MILTTTMCMSVMLYHEARSASIDEQISVAQVALNRAQVQDKPLCGVVFDKNQFNWSSKYKKKSFASYKQMLQYYDIKDQTSWMVAVGVASTTKFIDSSAYFYHDNTIKGFGWNKGNLVVVEKTPKFTFYRYRMDKLKYASRS